MSTKISSTGTKVLTNVFILFWLLGLSWMIYTKYQDGFETSFDFIFIGMAVFMGISVYKVITNMNKRLFDTVYDYGSHLIAIKNSKEYRIEYSNIMNVNYSDYQKSTEVALMLKNPVNGEDKICFNAKLDSPFKPKSEVIENLIKQIHRAQTNP